jgi:hypothetical protein
MELKAKRLQYMNGEIRDAIDYDAPFRPFSGLRASYIVLTIIIIVGVVFRLNGHL